jgi:antitoxin FitA
MPSITVKNIPTPLYQKIKKRAKAQHRSINSEIIACLERSTQSNRISSDDLILQARQMRNAIKATLTTDEIQKAIDQGRP